MPKTVEEAPRMNVEVVETLATSDQWVYYQDFDTGHVRRVSLDGRVRESVVESPKRKRVDLKWAMPSTPGEGRLHLSSVPESGHILIDVVPGLKRLRSSQEEIEWPAKIANSNVETAWNFEYELKAWARQPKDQHRYFHAILFRSGDMQRSCEFVTKVESPPPFLGMADRNHAILFDRPNVLIWNLKTDRRYCIAHAESAIVWPRNLHRKKRYAPIARCGKDGVVYEWNLGSPNDIEPKQGYAKSKTQSQVQPLSS